MRGLLMRLAYGCPPTLPDFDPSNQGWNQLREPSPRALALVGSILGIAIGVSLVWAWSLMDLDFSIRFNQGDFGSWGQLALLFIPLSPLLLLLAIIPLHEFIHALGCPRFGFTSMTIIGVWPSRFLFYAGHLEAMPAWRYLLYASAPFVVLSLLPLLIAYCIPGTALPCAAVSVMNGLCCGGDLILIVLVITQVPLQALVQNQGWSTWWKVAG